MSPANAPRYRLLELATLGALCCLLLPSSRVEGQEPEPQARQGDDDGDGGSGPGTGLPDDIDPESVFGSDEFELPGSSWRTWWDLNQEFFLELRRHVQRPRQLYSNDGFFLGHGAKQQVTVGKHRPGLEDVRSEVLPFLLQTLRDERAVVVQEALLLAIARGARALPLEERLAYLEPLRAALADKNRAVARQALLAIGVLGNPEGAFVLAEVLANSPEGRRQVGDSEVPDALRAFAAFGLGWLGADTENEDVRRFVVHHLVRAAEEDRTPSRDVEVAAFVALGMVPLEDDGNELSEQSAPPPAASLTGQLAFCLDVVDDARRDRLSRAHAAGALGRLFGALEQDRREILKEAFATRLAKSLRRFTPDPIALRQSAAFALGWMGDADDDAIDRRIRAALAAVQETQGDRATRQLALLSLARVAATPGRGGREPVDRVARHILRQLARGKGDARPFAALAAGLLGHELRRTGASVPAALSRAVQAALDEHGSPAEAGAYCIALGLLGATEATETLEEQLDSGRQELRGYAALALGLLGALDAMLPIRAELERSAATPAHSERLAVALALLEDDETHQRLTRQLAASPSNSTREALWIALGRTGDVRAIEPLRAAIRGERATQSERALAAEALGRVVEPDELPWDALFVPGTNYRTAPATLFGRQGVLGSP